MGDRMTRLGRILRERNVTYTSVAERAGVQARTVRQLATGETPMENATVGTVRQIAAALSVPVSALLDSALPLPGDDSMTRGARLSAAIREVMWPSERASYPSPLERGEQDMIAGTAADEFFADMPAVDARRG